MLITAEEYRALGFDWDNEKELDMALKRADYVILALTDGRALSAVAASGSAQQYVKRAAAFQTQQILETEFAKDSSSGGEERVSVGDFSYTKKQTEQTSVQPADTSLYIIGLLRTAGCLFSGMEAAE